MRTLSDGAIGNPNTPTRPVASRFYQPCCRGTIVIVALLTRSRNMTYWLTTAGEHLGYRRGSAITLRSSSFRCAIFCTSPRKLGRHGWVGDRRGFPGRDSSRSRQVRAHVEVEAKSDNSFILRTGQSLPWTPSRGFRRGQTGSGARNGTHRACGSHRRFCLRSSFPQERSADDGQGQPAQTGSKGSLLKSSLFVFMRSPVKGCTNSVAPACEERACNRKIGD